MRKFPFQQVDAFTKEPLSGNPCAIIFMEEEKLSKAEMQAIAKEMNLSETAFVYASEKADWAARYFTPAEEIPLAGHPTIATIFSLVETGRQKLSSERHTVSLELPAGIISVEIYAPQGKAEHIVMSQKKPQFLKIHRAEDVLPAFGLSKEDLLESVPLQTVSTGTPQLMIPVRNHNALKKAEMNTKLYRKLRERSDFFSPHLFCLEGATSAGQTFARHFGTPPDTAEDPFTGSATGAMAAYLWHYGLIQKPFFVAEQGHWMERPGKAQVEVVGPPSDIETVKVGGSAVTVLRGELILENSS